MRYDIAVIGTGPAGVSAAITATVRNKSVLLIGSAKMSEKMAKAHTIQNYPGLPAIPGADLAAAMKKHLDVMEIAITDGKATLIYPMGDYFSIQTSDNEIREASAVIVAAGMAPSKLYPGEEAFLGRGVSYCATCDGALYKGKTVAVIATTAEEEPEADFLTEYAAKVYYFPLYKGDVHTNEKVEIVRDVPVSVSGGMKVDTLTTKDGSFAVDGVFILRESVSPGQLVPGLEIEDNHVKVNRMMETNIPGCFACGDITGKPYQYIKAAGEGNVAALSAVSWLDAAKRAQKA